MGEDGADRTIGDEGAEDRTIGEDDERPVFFISFAGATTLLDGIGDDNGEDSQTSVFLTVVSGVGLVGEVGVDKVGVTWDDGEGCETGRLCLITGEEKEALEAVVQHSTHNHCVMCVVLRHRPMSFDARSSSLHCIHAVG